MTLSQEVRVELAPKAPLTLKGELSPRMPGGGQADPGDAGLVLAWRNPVAPDRSQDPGPWV